MGDGGTPPPPPTRHFTPDRGTFSAFGIISPSRGIARGSIFYISSHATEDHSADGESHNILHQVGGCASCNRVKTRAPETGSGRAGKRQEVGINIRTGTHCVQPLTLRVLLDLLTLRRTLNHWERTQRDLYRRKVVKWNNRRRIWRRA